MIDNKELQEGLSRVREVAACQNWLRFEDVATEEEVLEIFYQEENWQ